MYLIVGNCCINTCFPTVKSISNELLSCIIVLYISGILYNIIGIYLYEVLPKQFGVKRNILFFLNCLFNKEKSMTSQYTKLLDTEIDLSEDKEIREEAKKIKNLIEKYEKSEDSLEDYPLITDCLCKVYENTNKIDFEVANRKSALNNFCLCLKKNEIFGLLGPNGAGKTTFFSILTGIYEPTSGNAWVSGESILNNINKVQEKIGYCPQFDILWNELSILEHLDFYSKLKNVDEKQRRLIIDTTLEKTLLKPYKNYLVKELSGGMKRRLSLGISLVGNPSLVFLDEPTTGLDPENKRQIWDILSTCKEGKSMILTTHIMEEAEVLTDRIGIIINGELKCLGSKFKLKREYGKGFKLTLSIEEKEAYKDLLMTNIKSTIIEGEVDDDEATQYKNINNDLVNYIKTIFPNSRMVDKYKDKVLFMIPKNEFDAEKLLVNMSNQKEKYGILNWSITQDSLEDIFIRLTEKEIYT